MDQQNLSPLSSSTPHATDVKKVLLIIFVIVLVLGGAVTAYLKFSSGGAKTAIFENMNQAETATYLESISKTKFAGVTATTASSADKLPKGIKALIPEDRVTEVSSVTFDNGKTGYKIFFKHIDTTFDHAQQQFLDAALQEYTFVEGGRNPADDVVLMTYGNTEQYLKINMVKESDQLSEVTITVIPR